MGPMMAANAGFARPYWTGCDEDQEQEPHTHDVDMTR